MKRILAAVCAISLAFTAGACSPAKERVTGLEFDWDSAEAISFSQLLEEANEAHKQESLNREAFSELENYGETGGEYRNLLTEEEIRLLTEERPLNNQHISTDAFKEDIDLLFRALKSSYGPFFYFGGEETFGKVEKKLYDIVSDYDSDVPGNELINEFNDYLNFLRDRNFAVMGIDILTQKKLNYEYYYCDLYFTKDESGYYTLADGEKWYYDSCRNNGVSIRPVLTPEGEIKYSPVLLYPAMKMLPEDKMKLVCGEKMTETEFRWKKGESFRLGESGEDFGFAEAEGVSYIRMKNFASEEDSQIVRRFEETAEKVKDSKLIIYDLRGSRGEDETAAANWVAEFTGDEPQLNGCMITRQSVLADGDGTFDFIKTEGTFSENDIPVIVLVDSHTSAAGELALLYAKTMDNVIVIGSNTSGSQLSSKKQDIWLPNSGVQVTIPASMKLWNTMDNIDGIGYEPDIWCNPETVVDALTGLLEKEAYADAETIGKLDPKNKAVEEAMQHAAGPNSSGKMLIAYDKWIIGENDPFGGENFDDDLVPLYMGDRISGYTITFDDPGVAKVTYNEDGSVHIRLPVPGNWPFRLDYNGESYYFILAV